MFFSEHRLKMTSLRIGKHRIVKNIASLRKVNNAHPYSERPFWGEKNALFLVWEELEAKPFTTGQLLVHP